MDGLAYYPPSKKDVEDKRQIGHSTHDMKATYKLKWKVLESGEIGELPEWVEYETTKTLELAYDAYFEAVDRNS